MTGARKPYAYQPFFWFVLFALRNNHVITYIYLLLGATLDQLVLR